MTTPTGPPSTAPSRSPGPIPPRPSASSRPGRAGRPRRAGSAAPATPDYALDFRVGGTEINRGGPPGGPVFTYEATYKDIVPVGADRLWLHDGGRRHADLRLGHHGRVRRRGAGTTLTFTEQGVFLDGGDTPAVREKGTGELLDALGAALA